MTSCTRRVAVLRSIGTAAAAVLVAGCASAVAAPAHDAGGVNSTAGTACLKAISVVSQVRHTMSQLDAGSITANRAATLLAHDSDALSTIAATTTDETAPEAIQDVSDAVSAYASGTTNADLRSVAGNAVLGFAAVCPLSDGSFESGVSGWVVTGATLTRTPVAHDGAWAGLLTSSRAKGGSASATAPLVVAATRARSGYDIGLWARTDGKPITVSLRVVELRGGTIAGSAQQSVTVSSAWRSLSLRYRVKSPGSSLQVRVSASGLPAGGSLAIDGLWSLRH